jgi:hypothetical protein
MGQIMLRRALVLITLLGAVGCASAPPASPPLMAECVKLYGLWARYQQHPTFHHTGEKARAELALYGCQKGRYGEGIRELKRLLRAGRFILPDER